MSDLVEFRHLRYIVAIAQTANFTRAAERLFLHNLRLVAKSRILKRDRISYLQGTREGVRITPAGQMVIDYAQDALEGRVRILKIAKEVHFGNITPLRVGFSSFVNARHLHSFRSSYDKLFPNCGVQLSGGDTVHVLQRIDRGDLDCALLPMPVSGPKWIVHELAQTPLVACLRIDDPLAEQAQIDLPSLASRLTIFRDPDSHPSAHARLLQMFSEAGYSVTSLVLQPRRTTSNCWFGTGMVSLLSVRINF